MKHRMIFLAALVGLQIGATAARGAEYACETAYNGDDLIKDVVHTVTIGTGGAGISRFEFLSFTPPSATLCAYIADVTAKAEDDDAKALLPVWSPTADGVQVTLPSSRGDSAVLRVADKGTHFLLEILETGSTEEFCNLYGIAAPVVKIYKDNKTCGFPKQ